MDLLRLLVALWRHKLLATLLFATCLGASVAYLRFAPKVYETSASLAAAPNTAAGQSGEFNGLVDRLLPTLAQLAEGEEVRDAVSSVAPDEEPTAVRADALQGTLLLRVTVRHTDPESAAAWSNAIARVLPRFNSNAEIATLAVTERARVPTTPAAPVPSVVVPLAVLLGLALAVTGAVLAESVRRSRQYGAGGMGATAAGREQAAPGPRAETRPPRPWLVPARSAAPSATVAEAQGPATVERPSGRDSSGSGGAASSSRSAHADVSAGAHRTASEGLGTAPALPQSVGPEASGGLATEVDSSPSVRASGDGPHVTGSRQATVSIGRAGDTVPGQDHPAPHSVPEVAPATGGVASRPAAPARPADPSQAATGGSSGASSKSAAAEAGTVPDGSETTSERRGAQATGLPTPPGSAEPVAASEDAPCGGRTAGAFDAGR